MTTPQPQPSAETRADKICDKWFAEIQEEMGDMAPFVEARKELKQLILDTFNDYDSFRAKAEALDWLELNRHKIKIEFWYNNGNPWRVSISQYNSKLGVYYKRVFGDTLLSAITAARKDSE